MTKMAALIQQTSEAMNLLSTNYYLSVKELLISSNWKYSHRCTKRRYSHTPKVICEGEAFNLPGKYVYSYRLHGVRLTARGGASICCIHLVLMSDSISCRYSSLYK